ncbi:MAG TPA: hypothetical protein VGG99_04160 [Acetobacteraceae bacterium]
MRLFITAACAALLLSGAAAAAQPVPLGANPETGARPGNEIGTGMSMPMSDKAGNIGPQDTATPIAARLPPPDVGDDASVHALLLAARAALIADRTGEAQEALERAETRALDRSVPLLQTGVPSESPLVAKIRSALRTLGTGDRMGTARLLDEAINASGSVPAH